MQRIITVALGVVIALAALAAASAQDTPPHRFYGTDATAGDEIVAQVHHGDHYDTVGSATVGDDGSWYIDVPADMADEVEFTVNGEHADAAVVASTSDSTQVSLTVEAMTDDAMDDGDDVMTDDAMGDEDNMTDDAMDDDEGAMLDEEATEFPDTGSGGLADNGSGVSAGLIGLLIALSAASVTGLGLRRMRNRA